MTYGLMTPAIAVLALCQTLVLWRLSKRMKAVSRVNDRLAQFAEALALLTDTTEAGLATVAAELEEPGRRRSSRTTTRSASRRIATAARRGQAIEEIAAAEGLSASEVRLHLHMTNDSDAKGALHGPLRV